MTTPNNPTPPPGMEILTDYTQPLPEGALYEIENGTWVPSRWVGCIPLRECIYAVPATGDTANDEEGEGQEWRPKDRLIARPSPLDVSTWYIVTESDQLHIAAVRCIVAEGFAKGLVETWNSSLESHK